MTDTTIARPYAKALLTVARSQHTETVWQEVLDCLAYVVLHTSFKEWMSHPRLSKQQTQDLLLEALQTQQSQVFNLLGEDLARFVQLIIEGKRLALLPAIAILYRELMQKEEGVLPVIVKTAFSLSREQQHSLEQALQKRFRKKPRLDIVEDKSLLGGLLIQVGHLVLDGSSRGKLKQLADGLMGYR